MRRREGDKVEKKIERDSYRYVYFKTCSTVCQMHIYLYVDASSIKILYLIKYCVYFHLSLYFLLVFPLQLQFNGTLHMYQYMFLSSFIYNVASDLTVPLYNLQNNT